MSDEYALLSAFALYDTLNDDDDEVRDLSAKTTSSLLSKSLLPLAARLELAEFISQLHGEQPSYISNMLCRITGTDTLQASKLRMAYDFLESAEVQLLKEMKKDDSLFVEEEQNLFIDEVREAQLWCGIFEELCAESQITAETEGIWKLPLHDLILWVLNGLKTLNRLLETEDGVLGWTSKPSVFAICMRIILCTNAVLSQKDVLFQASGKSVEETNHLVKEITAALQEFVTLGRKRRVHESLLYAVR